MVTTPRIPSPLFALLVTFGCAASDGHSPGAIAPASSGDSAPERAPLNAGASGPLAARVAQDDPATTNAPQAAHETSPDPALGMTLESIAAGAILLPDLGVLHRPVTTSSPEAQSFFDQGLRLTYGFNHDEAARSFAHAAALDPWCAMCFWGAAYTLGPNYNVPMLPDRAAAAWDALTHAQAAGRDGTATERALIGALAARHAGPAYVEPAAMQPLHEAYAVAMREVAEQFPTDVDVLVLAAEAGMNVNPWKLWSLDGEPAPGTDAIVDLLEAALARDPVHPGANHYYIHAVEASRRPERALPAADRLGALMPGAGHIVHMPAHIYQRIGRYADASEANRRAIDADERYLATITPLGYYPFYLGHNYGFLAYSSSMEGRGRVALDAARRSASSLPHDLVCGMPGMDFFLAEPLLVMVRFGLWDELLAEPEPLEPHAVHRAFYQHARGMAFAALGRLDEARAALGELQRFARELPEEQLAGLNSGRKVLGLAAKVLEARIAEKAGDASAIALYEEAVALEDRLAYNEPADWFYPVRHYLGAALLDAGRAADAAAAYQADLERHADNGWALFGLARALRMARRNGAAEVEARFRRAFRAADFTPERTAF